MERHESVDEFEFDLTLDDAVAPVPMFTGGRADDMARPAASMSRRDAEAFIARVHADYASRLQAFAYGMLRSREDAEDAVQTVFLNAYTSVMTGRVPEQELSWLYRITRNVCLNRIRTTKRKPAQTIEGFDVAAQRGLDEDVADRLHMRQLKIALGQLPGQQRDAIVLREMRGASYEEIASELGTSQAAVESLLFRARRNLAEQLRNAGVRPAADAA